MIFTSNHMARMYAVSPCTSIAPHAEQLVEVWR